MQERTRRRVLYTASARGAPSFQGPALAARTGFVDGMIQVFPFRKFPRATRSWAWWDLRQGPLPRPLSRPVEQTAPSNVVVCSSCRSSPVCRHSVSWVAWVRTHPVTGSPGAVWWRQRTWRHLLPVSASSTGRTFEVCVTALVLACSDVSSSLTRRSESPESSDWPSAATNCRAVRDFVWRERAHPLRPRPRLLQRAPAPCLLGPNRRWAGDGGARGSTPGRVRPPGGLPSKARWGPDGSTGSRGVGQVLVWFPPVPTERNGFSSTLGRRGWKVR